MAFSSRAKRSPEIESSTDGRRGFLAEVVDDAQDAEPAAIDERVRHQANDQYSPGFCGIVNGACVPEPRLRPRRLFKVSLSARQKRYSFLQLTSTPSCFRRRRTRQ